MQTHPCNRKRNIEQDISINQTSFTEHKKRQLTIFAFALLD